MIRPEPGSFLFPGPQPFTQAISRINDLPGGPRALARQDCDARDDSGRRMHFVTGCLPGFWSVKKAERLGLLVQF